MDSWTRRLERQALAGDSEALHRLQRLHRAMKRCSCTHKDCKHNSPICGQTVAELDLCSDCIDKHKLRRLQRVWDYLWNGGSPLVEGLDWFEGLAGEDAEGPVIVGDWNDRDRWDPETQTRVVTDRTPSRALAILERLTPNAGYWSDEYLRCDCGKGFRTSPDSYSFRQEDYGVIWDGDWACADCIESMRCGDCGKPDLTYPRGHCDQLPEVHDGDDWTTGYWCHCGHGCEHDTRDEDDEE